MKPPLFREDPTVFESSQYLIFSRIMKQIITLLDHYVEKVHPPTRLGKKKKEKETEQLELRWPTVVGPTVEPMESGVR